MRSINRTIAVPISIDFYPWEGWTYSTGLCGDRAYMGIEWWEAVCCQFGAHPPAPTRKFCVYKNNGAAASSPRYKQDIIAIIEPEYWSYKGPNWFVTSGTVFPTKARYQLVFRNAPTPVIYPGKDRTDVFIEPPDDTYDNFVKNVPGLVWWTRWLPRLNESGYTLWWSKANQELDEAIEKWNKANPRYKIVECKGDDADKKPCKVWNCTKDITHPVVDCLRYDPETATIGGRFVCDPDDENYCSCEQPPGIPGGWLPSSTFPGNVSGTGRVTIPGKVDFYKP